MKEKLLLITDLYPGFKGQSRKYITYAIKELLDNFDQTKYEIKVIVIWIYYDKFFLNLKKILKRKGFIELDAIKHNNAYLFSYMDNDIEVIRFPIHKIPKKRINYLQYSKKIYELLKTNNFIPNKIITHGVMTGGIYAKYLKEKYDINYSICLHQMDINYYRTNKNRSLYHDALKQAKKIFFRNHIIEDYYRNNIENKNIGKKEHGIVFSGVDVKPIKNKSFSNKKLNIITVSTFIKRKNIDFIIKVLKRVEFDYEFNIVGDGPEKNNLIKLVNSTNQNNKINFLGFLEKDKVINLLEHSDVFILISVKETLGLVYLEAMRKGCITIGTKNEGIDGIIINGENGFLCEANNEKELENLLVKIFNMSKTEKLNLSKKAVETSCKFTLKKASDNYQNLIEDL